MEKALLIDGHGLAFRAHYALINQNLTTADGLPSETIFGFFRMLSKLLHDLKPKYLAIFFDPQRPTFRQEIFKDYKANRKETPEELRLQIDEIQEICRLLNLPVFIPEKEEADDYIASFVEKFSNKNLQIAIASSDKDLFSILRPNVVLMRAKKGVSEFVEINPNTLKKELGILPQQVVDFMALTGDTSDNVPGVKGIGEKTAAKLIQEYQTLENIYNNLENIHPPSLREKLRQDRENAFLSQKLVSLKKDLPLPFELKDLDWQNKLKDITIFLKKGLKSIYQEFEKLAKKETESHLFFQEKDELSLEINRNYVVIKDLSDLQNMISSLKQKKYVSVDTETNSLFPFEADLVGLSFCYQENKVYFSYYVPCNFDKKNVPLPEYQELPKAEEVLPYLKPILEDKNILKICQNGKYDILVLKNYGIELSPVVDDTMIMAYVLDPSRRRYNMDDLAAEYLQYKTITYDELTLQGRSRIPLVALPLKKVAQYACEDAEVTYRLWEVLSRELEKSGLYLLYREIDMPLMEVLVEMETNGVALDREMLKDFEKKLLARLENTEKQIFALAQEEFLINSTQKLREVLFEKLKIRPVKKTEKGALSTDAEVLEELRGEHPIVELLLEHRSLSKLLNTYVQVLPQFIDKKTGRIHTSFSQVSTATGRLASHDPNLQNIPVKGEDGKALRRAFVASPNFSLLSLDYSQIELRILAHYSEDKNLIRAYLNDEDIHDQAAYLLFHHRFDPERGVWLEKGDMQKISFSYDPEILKKMKETKEFSDFRSKAKVLNFSIAYGVTDFGLSRNLGISKKEAQELIDLYFTAFPGIKSYMEKAKALVRDRGYAENLFGRRRYIPEIRSSNRYARQGAERLAINTPIQSTAADIIKLAMIKIQEAIRKEKYKSKMLLQIHDELLFEVYEEEKEEFYKLAKSTMENIVKLHVPLKVSGGFGKNWDEAK